MTLGYPNPNVDLWPFNPKPCHLYRISQDPYTKYEQFWIIRFWFILQRLVLTHNSNFDIWQFQPINIPLEGYLKVIPYHLFSSYAPDISAKNALIDPVTLTFEPQNNVSLLQVTWFWVERSKVSVIGLGLTAMLVRTLWVPTRWRSCLTAGNPVTVSSEVGNADARLIVLFGL